MTFTEQQRIAVETHDKNLAVIAGAGSGKTHVLVSRFLALLEKNPDWALNAIVAITFTKKAAAEMRDRVRMQIENRYFDALTRDDAVTANRWQRLLAQMDSARITTIHSLCGELLRTNAATMGLDPRFQIAEEVDNVTRLYDVVEQVLVDINQNIPELIELFIYYTPSQVRKILNNVAIINADIDLPTSEADILQQWDRGQCELIANLIRQAQELEHKSAEHDPDNNFIQDFLTVYPLPDLETILTDPASHLLNPFTALNFRLGGNKDADLVKFRGEVKAFRDVLKKQLESDPANEQTALRLTLLWSQLIAKVRHAYREAKSRDNVLDFDDLERLASELLAHEEIRTRYQNQEIKHVMVDEFQDTNATQWQIVKGLANIMQGGALFVVGDPKQSIYAFRGADVSVFGDVCQEISAVAVGEEIKLTRSFRTHQPLVDTLNHLFGELLLQDNASPASKYQVTLGDKMDAQRTEPPTHAPAIEIITLEEQDMTPPPDYREWEAHEIAQRIHQWVKEGRLIDDRHQKVTRPIQYGDVAILFRAFSYVNVYEQVFKAQRLPYITLSGRGYYDTQEIWDCRNALQALYAPSDHLALVSALRSPLFTVSDSALFLLSRIGMDAQTGQANYYEALGAVITNPDHLASLPESDQVALSFAYRTFEALRQKAGRVTIAELLRELVGCTGYLATLDAMPDGSQRRSNVEKLIQKAESSGRITLSAFLQYLNDMSTQEAREGEAMTSTSNSVNIMTVHASKGLEFPAVILGDMSYGGNTIQSTLELDPQFGLSCRFTPEDETDTYNSLHHKWLTIIRKAKEDAELLRLLYVGATRAQDVLVFSGKYKYDGKNDAFKSRGWFDTLLKTFDMPVSLDEETLPTWLDGKPVIRHNPSELPTRGQQGESALFRWVAPDNQTAVAPVLTVPYRVARIKRIKHLAATHIADIGAIETASPAIRQYYRDKFRRRVLYDAPNRVEAISTERNHDVPPYLIGQIVHEALRHWHIPSRYDAEKMNQILTAYAWRVGLTQPETIQTALEASLSLLQQFEGSTTYQAIIDAKPSRVYREMPFMYRVDEERMIHGIIDIVYQDQAGDWHVGDYKTGRVYNQRYQEHAQRYLLQVGIYASALTAKLGIIPKTFIHYVESNTQYEVPQADWEEALQAKSLHQRIDEILEGKS